MNQARARLLADAGLHITRVGQGETTIPIRVVTTLAGVDPFDLVFVAVKTYQTGDAVRAALEATKASTLFFSLQNGIGNAETIAAIVGEERVLCGVTYHSIEHAGPGRLRYRAGIKPIQIARLRGGPTPEVAGDRRGVPASRLRDQRRRRTSTTRSGRSCCTTRS